MHTRYIFTHHTMFVRVCLLRVSLHIMLYVCVCVCTNIYIYNIYIYIYIYAHTNGIHTYTRAQGVLSSILTNNSTYKARECYTLVRIFVKAYHHVSIIYIMHNMLASCMCHGMH
jgi:hypothetical protein